MRDTAKFIAGLLGIISLAFGVGLVIAILLTTAPKAQPTAPPTEQALGNKLLAEIQAGLSCSAQTIQLQMRVRELEAKVRQLEPKPVAEDK